MPKNSATKRAARSYAAEHGVSYVEAHRIVTTTHADPVQQRWAATAALFDGLVVGDQVRFRPGSGRAWWTIRARDARYVVATCPAPFQPRGALWYCVVDLTGWNRRYNGVGPGVVRSSLNTLGGGWGDLGPDGAGCEEILDGLVTGQWALSVRRVCPVESIEQRPRSAPRQPTAPTTA